MTRITRVEVIDENGRSYVNWEEDNDITVSYQDDGRTLKVFVNTMKPKSPAEEAFKRVYGAYPPTTPSVSNFEDTRWSVFQNGYNASKVSETPQEPEDNEWKTVALGFGENLSAIGPCGYYDFTPVEWYDWVVDIYENTANEYLKLLEKERAKAKAQKHEKELIRESKKWCEENQNESVEDYLTPRGPQGPQGPVGPGPGPKGVIVGYEPTPQERGDRIHKEVENEIEKLQEKNWYVDAKTLLKSEEPEVEEYLKPHTPEKTEKLLREAFQKVQQTEEWKETQRKIDAPKESWMNKFDEELVAMLEKNPPEFLKFELGKTLEELICKCMVDYNSIIPVGLLEDILNNIEKWLPDFQSHEGTQSASVIDLVDGYNDALTKIKSKLRNKK